MPRKSSLYSTTYHQLPRQTLFRMLHMDTCCKSSSSIMWFRLKVTFGTFINHWPQSGSCRWFSRVCLCKSLLLKPASQRLHSNTGRSPWSWAGACTSSRCRSPSQSPAWSRSCRSCSGSTWTTQTCPRSSAVEKDIEEDMEKAHLVGEPCDGHLCV